MAADLSAAGTGDIVAAAQAGDRAAFGVLYERFGPLVHGVLLANADRQDVADLVQDVFLVAMERIRTLRNRDAFGSWVSAIARNEARMLHRRTRETVELSQDAVSSAETDDDSDAGEVMAALNRVPVRYREPLLLRLVEGMNGESIAEQLGLSHGTVRVYLHHGMGLLRKEIGDRHA